MQTKAPETPCSRTTDTVAAGCSQEPGRRGGADAAGRVREPAVAATGSPADDRAVDAAECVLIVEDEEHVRRLLVRWLENAGFRAVTAGDACAARAAFAREQIAVVLADIYLPDEDGLELLAWVRANAPVDTGVIMGTADTDRQLAVRALHEGAWSYLIKPFTADEVVIHVAEAFERRRRVQSSLDFQRHLELEVERRTRAIRQREEEIAWRLLWASDSRDSDTAAHVRRIGLLSRALACEVGWPPAQAEDLKLAAAMHDIGKIGVPDAILLKPGPLTAPERRVMQRHTVIGAEILRGSEVELVRMAERIALCHHERWDGRGYPQGLRGEEIPEAARIVAIVDVYDALLSPRPYRDSFAESTAIEIMSHLRGKQFDPRLYDVFERALPELRRLRGLVGTTLRFAA